MCCVGVDRYIQRAVKVCCCRCCCCCRGGVCFTYDVSRCWVRKCCTGSVHACAGIASRSIIAPLTADQASHYTDHAAAGLDGINLPRRRHQQQRRRGACVRCVRACVRVKVKVHGAVRRHCLGRTGRCPPVLYLRENAQTTPVLFNILRCRIFLGNFLFVNKRTLLAC